MRTRAEASNAVCHVCGQEQELDPHAVVAAAQLAAFTVAHGNHDRFRIDVVVHPPHGTDPTMPEQRRAS